LPIPAVTNGGSSAACQVPGWVPGHEFGSRNLAEPVVGSVCQVKSGGLGLAVWLAAGDNLARRSDATTTARSASTMISTSTQRHVPRIGVVIPYFQRDPGLLNRALSSVAAQEHSPVQVVVVDDGSPRAAVDEITPELRGAVRGLTVIRQPNKGVAAARNAGLDALSDEVSAVALLDSDDCWERAHLRKAADALSSGADFFFSNAKDAGETVDRLRAHPLRGQLRSSEPVPGAPGILRWSGGVPALFVDGCVFHTSAAVFRRDLMQQVRFPVSFRRAGEDQVAFWSLLVRSSVIMFCAEPTVVAGGGGLGIWRNSTVGTAAHLVRLADEIRWRRYMISDDPLHNPLSPAERRRVRRAIAARRSTALYSTLHLLRRRRNLLNELAYLLRSDPLCAASWCADLPRLVYRKIRRLPHTPAET
jgi:succinoglycan biosynthesis protein ExoW